TDGELLPIAWQGVDEWLRFLEQGPADRSVDADDPGVKELGIRLFEHTLGASANQATWGKVIQYAREHGLTIRLLIDTSIPRREDAADDKIHNLPYGLLRERDDNYYLFVPPKGNQDRPAIDFVRVLRRCTPRPIKLISKPLRVLLAAAEPG